MSAIPTHASQVVKNLEYVEEITYGLFPTNPVMTFLAQTAVWRPNMNVSLTEFRRLGSEDVFEALGGREIYKSTLEFGIANSTFLKHGINAIVGAGTIAKSLAIGMSVKLNNVENFIQLEGSRIATLTLHGSPSANILEVTAELEHEKITTPSATDYIGTGSHATAETAAPWTYIDGGANPITWGASALPLEDITCRFERTLATRFVMGSRTVYSQYPVRRRISGDFTAEWQNTSQEADLKATTKRNLAWVLKSATSTLTLTDAYLMALADRPLDPAADDSAIEKFTFVAETANVT